jgi:LacI family transcriptional regulator
MKPKMIYIMTDTSRNSGRKLLQSILRFSMSRYDWRLNIMEANDAGRRRLAEAVLGDVADGIITSMLESAPMERMLEKSSIPLVVIGTRRNCLPRRSANLAIVALNEQRLGREVGQYLFRLGSFRSIGFVHPRKDFLKYLASLRAKGFRDELAADGMAISEYIPIDDETQDAKAMQTWIEDSSKPMAVVAATDAVAVSVYAACERAGAKIPKDVRVIGIDNDELTCLSLKPELSSFSTDMERQGEVAAEVLERIMSQRKGYCKRKDIIMLGGGEPIERHSTQVLSPGLALVKRAQEYIERNADRRISIDDVIAFLRVSKRTAYLRFAQFSNKTILQTINEARIGYVKKCLRSSRQSILSISRMADFQNPNHLKTLFRNLTGMTMREWRAQNRTTPT